MIAKCSLLFLYVEELRARNSRCRMTHGGLPSVEITRNTSRHVSTKGTHESRKDLWLRPQRWHRTKSIVDEQCSVVVKATILEKNGCRCIAWYRSACQKRIVNAIIPSPTTHSSPLLCSYPVRIHSRMVSQVWRSHFRTIGVLRELLSICVCWI